ncbi:E3 ubiquitin-protein ligase MARCH5 [Chelonia mydas]|uniref:E3 ubiquitin-protein ligase MARCHF5 n=1 Tax=Chelonia mydas TaxID=8469 RepID=M7BY47_CHEMY|nr:E3 ubiquitin-protein ligase MARCH5 [Chelonia mydas]
MVRRSPSFPSALTRGGGGSLALTSQRCHPPFRLLSPRSVWSLRPAPDRSHPGPVLRLAACPAPCLRREEAPVSPALVSGFGPGIRPTPPDTAAAAGPPGSPHPENMSDQAGSALQQTMDRSCWVCFATDEDDRTAEWVRPCRCRGSTKWVHQTCLQRWVDEKQRGNSTARVACPQCNAEYLIVFPKLALEGSQGHIRQELEENLSSKDLTSSIFLRSSTYLFGGIAGGDLQEAPGLSDGGKGNRPSSPMRHS